MKKFSKILTLLSASILLGFATPALSSHAANVNQSHSNVTRVSANKRWTTYRSRMFAANNYNIYRNNWQKAGNTKSDFHHTFNIKGQLKDNNRTYYKLYNGKHYLGYANKHALVNVNKTTYLKVPYISQYRPVFAPWGCSEASLAMLLESKAGHSHVNLPYIFRHTPKYPMKGGQVGNVYTGAGFGHVVSPAALTRYAHHWNKHVKNISGSSVNQIKMYVQSGHPVLFYGYSSYQKPYDHNRNHCKVITAYRHGYFRINDPLYYTKHAKAGQGGHNMMFDHGAISWLSLKRFNYEYAVVRGSNRKSALTV